MVQGEQGFSLIEVMIALVIALILTIAIGQVFLGNKQTYKTQEDLARMQEDARFVIENMSRAIRLAGYKGNGSTVVFPNPVLDGTDSGTSTGSDTLIVRYAGSSLLSNVLTADGSVIDCLGNGVPLNTISFNQYYIANDPANNNEPTLFCDTTDDGVQNGTALIPGVESMQILWGEDTDADSAPNYYVPVGSVANKGNVVVLRISLLMRTFNQVGVAVDGKTYQHFGADYPNYATDNGASFVAPADLRIRRFFSTAVGLRNRLN
jgi:type IV pilus assembly protein PilW